MQNYALAQLLYINRFLLSVAGIKNLEKNIKSMEIENIIWILNFSQQMFLDGESKIPYSLLTPLVDLSNSPFPVLMTRKNFWVAQWGKFSIGGIHELCGRKKGVTKAHITAAQ